jgi:type IV pilus assembly protein PilY1
MKSRFLQILLFAALALVRVQAQAEDIDLFSGVAGSNGAPNLLIVIDNAANFSSSASPASAGTCTLGGATNTLSGTVGGIEQCALYTVLNSMTVTFTATVNIGIMVYSGPDVVDYQGNSTCSSGSLGGCLVYPMVGLNTTTKPTLLAWIKSWKTTGGSSAGQIKASGEGTGSAIQEAWAYYAGKTGLSGKNYAGIQPATTCAKQFVVFIGNSYSSSGSPGDPNTGGPQAPLEGTASPTGVNASPAATTAQKAIITNTGADSVTSCGTVNFPSNHATSGFYADEWTRYMASQNITTYTIGVLGASCQASYAWLLASMAANGGPGIYFPTTDYSGLVTAFQTVLSEVQSVNSVFASVSLPISVNTQGTLLNQLFVGMFRPDADSLPRWMGNLKQYKLGYVNGVLRTVDADGKSAVSSGGSDFVSECARSYWTPSATTTGDGYWTNFTAANCAGYPAPSNSPDGNIVEKGGQAYTLRSATPSTRTVKTCSLTFSSCTTLTDFTTSNAAITEASFGLATGATNPSLSTLINWARGTNSKGETASLNGTAITTSSMRPSVHGDVVHSRPAAVNMGTDNAPNVVVFYGANDGMLRAINGNQTATFTIGPSTTAGSEFWAFMPPEFYANVKRLYDNTALISTPSITGTPKNYGMDGPIVTYKTSAGDLWVYAAMRRGGRALYAFNMDHSNLAITLKWKHGCGDTGTSNCTNDGNGDWRKIGQTWATPTVITAPGYTVSGTIAPMLVMGGGYDTTCEDATSCTTTTTGNHIYVLDADTGKILKDFTTDRSVVGDVNIVPDSSGYITFGYASDLGGNLYRISGVDANTAIGSTAPGSWTITKIASLGCATATTCTSPPNRKFIYGPEVLVDTANNKNILLLGSGDREKPLVVSNPTTNYFFRVDDMPTVTTYLSAESSANCPGVSVICLNSLLAVTGAAMPTTAQLAAKKGWYRSLAADEQVVTSALTIFGVIEFATNTPQSVNPNSCKANLGLAKFYQMDYATGENPNGTTDNPYTTSTSGGLPPPPVAGVALVDGVPTPFKSCENSLQTCLITPPGNTLNPAKVRSYWFLQK